MDHVKKSFMKRLDTAIELLEKWFVVLSATLLFLIMSIISLNSILRFLFNINLVWSIEVSEYMMLYITFLTAPWLLRHGEHIYLEILYDAVSDKLKMVFNIICNFLGLCVSLLLTIYGFTVTLDSFVRNITLYNSLQVPKFVMLMIIPVSGLFIFLEFSRKLLLLLPKNNNVPKKIN